MAGWQDYFTQYKSAMNTGKQNALGAIDKAQQQAMTQQAGMAGAAGLAGGGGRALKMVGDTAAQFGQQKADVSNQYDQQVAGQMYQQAKDE